MHIIQQIEGLGLNSKQAKVYLACLELGQATALEISRQSQLKRSTVYVILDELKFQNLVHELRKGTTTVFYPERPEKLGEVLEHKVQTFQNIKPLLDDLYNKEGSKPNVKFYFGVEEVEQLYMTILHEHTDVYFFGTDLQRFEQAFPNLFSKVAAHIHDNKHVVRQIVTDSPYNRKYARLNYHPRWHKVRVIQGEYSFFGDNALYGSTLLITSPSEPFSVTIESKDVYRTFVTLFEIAWDISQRPRDLRKKK